MKRHGRDNYYVLGEGVLTDDGHGHPIRQRPSTLASLRKFRFSRLGDVGSGLDDGFHAIVAKVGEAMATTGAGNPDSVDPPVPAGYTYLGQFVDHDMTADKTAKSLGEDVTVAELLQGRSPALDLDSLYGRGPYKEPQYYAADRVKLRTGTTVGVPFPPDNPVASQDQDGFDLPRVGQGATSSARRAPLIPDGRNDENLAVGQTHLMFIKFHNAVVDHLAATTPGALLFGRARGEVVKHYQWMLRHDFLPRIVDDEVLDDVWTYGRRFFEVPSPYGDGYDWYGGHWDRYLQPGDTPTMPIEFSVGAYRLGHSQVRARYDWNAVFTGRTAATLGQLFRFSGTSGNFTPNGGSPDDVSDLGDPDSPGLERLPSNWIADFRRLYDFAEAGRPDLAAPEGAPNLAKRLDTLLVDPLKNLPLGAFDGRGQSPVPSGHVLNLAFRNLVRAGMVKLASGQQMAKQFGLEPLTEDQILSGDGGAVLDTLTAEEAARFVDETPLWFYTLREVELAGGRLTGVGGRIVAEVFHRSMEGSVHSIVRDSAWRPSFGTADTFSMVDLLLFAVGDRPTDLFPLG